METLRVGGWAIAKREEGQEWTLTAPEGEAPAVRISTEGDLSVKSVSVTSDRSLKTDIAEVPRAEARRLVEKLRPVRFRWKSSGESSFGFVAQEVREVSPQLVDQDPRTGMMRIKALEMLPLLLAEVQELRKELGRRC